MKYLDEKTIDNFTDLISNTVFDLNYLEHDKKFMNDLEKCKGDISQINLFKDCLDSLRQYMGDNNIENEIYYILVSFRFGEYKYDYNYFVETLIKKIRNKGRAKKIKYFLDD